MIIKEIFEKDIFRHLEGVVKVGADNPDTIKEELEEYVITAQVQKNLKSFFSYYLKTSRSGIGDVGAWITGFFGSGKSHFLKILSYILDNEPVFNKSPLDYLADRIDDNFLLADMKAAGDIDTDIILFDIDSASDPDARNSKEMIVKVFNRKFNELQGFSGSMPWLADIERQMVKNGTYEKFKETYNEVAGVSWENGRDDDLFGEDNFVKTAVLVNGMSEESARNTYQSAPQKFSLAVDKFAKIVREYIESKGKNYNLVFMVDEVGQYIGGDKALILNLQSIVQCLQIECSGRAWVVVTSQEAIDSVAKVINPADFSKVTGRFPVRLTMSSANVDEVIKKRLLIKTEAAGMLLNDVYREKNAGLKNLVSFSSDTPSVQKFKNEQDFIDIYPFLPYQFNLLQSTFNSIRTRGASGKHLSQGERSLLSAFKESSMAYSTYDIGVLIPFREFYNTVETFLEHDIHIVMERAEKKDTLQTPFDLDMLKVLFMIKDLDDEMPANIENLTTLMLSSINEDKILLRKNVDESLKRLMTENLIQRDGEKFIFLTNEEQDINREIDQMPLDSAEIISFIGNQIFSGICDARIRYSNTFMPAYNQIIDDNPRGQQSNELALHIFTPYYGHIDESEIMLKTQMTNSVALVMTDDKQMAEETEGLLKLDKFIRTKGHKASTEAVKRIMTLKADEFSRKNQRVFEMIKSSIAGANIYSKASKLTINTMEAKEKINEAFRFLIESTFTKLNYIKKPVQKTGDLAVILETDIKQLVLDDTLSNKLALAEVKQHLDRQNEMMMPTTMRGLVEKFQKIPFGWVELDIAGLVAELFVGEEIVLLQSNKVILPGDSQLVNYLTKREFRDTLKIKLKEKTSVKLIEDIKHIFTDIFAKSIEYTTDGKFVEAINMVVDTALDTVRDAARKYPADGKYKSFDSSFKQAADNPLSFAFMYPGYDLVNEWNSMFEAFKKIYDPKTLFETFAAREADLRDYRNNIGTITDFFKNQVKIFEKACRTVDLYENNKSYLEGADAAELVEQIRSILKLKTPYREIYRLVDLNKKFDDMITDVLDDEAKPVISLINCDKKIATEAFQTCNLGLPANFEAEFAKLIDKVKTCQLVSTIIGVKEESARIRDSFCNQAAETYKTKRCKESGEDDLKIKTIKSVSLMQLLGGGIRLETVADIEKLTEDLKVKLIDLLDDETIISLK